MRIRTVVLLTLVFLTGCTRLYKPEIYDLPADRIPAFVISGEVAFANDQAPGNKQRSELNAFSALEYQLDEVTAGFNQQLSHEIAKSGKPNGLRGSKLIKSKVTGLSCRPAGSALVPSFMFVCSIAVDIETGDGERISITAQQSAPVFARAGRNGGDRSLDGTIATGVAEVLSNRTVLGYLSR